MDDFSWGNTRVVVGEGKEKTVLTSEGEYFDDSMIPLKKFSGQFAVSLAFFPACLAC
jgi:chitin synthase